MVLLIRYHKSPFIKPIYTFIPKSIDDSYIRHVKERSMKIKRSKKGFTLLELLIVVIIMGILATVAIPQFTTFVDRAGAAEAIHVIGAIRTAIALEAAETTGTSIAAMADDTAIESTLNIDLGNPASFDFSTTAITVAGRVVTAGTVTATETGGTRTVTYDLSNNTWGGDHPGKP
jgi:type IV pilus assembly protein PilA